ncbi:MarR family transcriptional regulator [Yinghuangia sp. ASG 101]|uniref:MarR family winged helix-turn-helix transcriptional regulator n=1 Tax=Yinghuangia sp. ASG 101 TaxID=2896848 RepID=UPI001E501EBC|nr:MarR family transcriptional regulator [Yinghuangia sp. ASG 101]UGQ13243.1 MarR family transcriptional regulator [Yinghuangia sp. ASG 101]
MDGYELFQLGRDLMKLGEQSMPGMGLERLSGPTRAILFDIAENPESSISDITARVKLPQSQVSACVARLRDRGTVTTESDPLDRRRTLVRLSDDSRRRAAQRPPAPIDEAVAKALGADDPARVERVKAALDALAEALGSRE